MNKIMKKFLEFATMLLVAVSLTSCALFGGSTKKNSELKPAFTTEEKQEYTCAEADRNVFVGVVQGLKDENFNIFKIDVLRDECVGIYDFESPAIIETEKYVLGFSAGTERSFNTYAEKLRAVFIIKKVKKDDKTVIDVNVPGVIFQDYKNHKDEQAVLEAFGFNSEAIENFIAKKVATVVNSSDSEYSTYYDNTISDINFIVKARQGLNDVAFEKFITDMKIIGRTATIKLPLSTFKKNKNRYTDEYKYLLEGVHTSYMSDDPFDTSSYVTKSTYINFYTNDEQYINVRVGEKITMTGKIVNIGKFDNFYTIDLKDK